MQFKIQVSIADEHGETITEDVIVLDKSGHPQSLVGLSLSESKQLLKRLQQIIIHKQANQYASSHRQCPYCNKKRRIRGSYSIQYRTLFGIVTLPNLRLYHCRCRPQTVKTFSLLSGWLSEHNSPELLYIEMKWASLMSYGMTFDLLKDVLPVNDGLHSETVRHHLHKTAR